MQDKNDDSVMGGCAQRELALQVALGPALIATKGFAASEVEQAYALIFVSFLRHYRREPHLTQEWAEKAMAISLKQGFPHWVQYGGMVRGWALAERGQEGEGIAQIRQGLAAYRAIGSELWRSYYLALLAEVYRKVGQPEEGLRVLVEALTLVEKTGERFYEAELYRLYGELSLRMGERETRKQSPGHPLFPSGWFAEGFDTKDLQDAKALLEKLA